MNTDDDDVPECRLPCDFCHRKFNPDSLVKHSRVCEKTLSKKRKVFDSAKQRIQGTELAEFLPSIIQSKKQHEKFTSNLKSRSRWKENHMALIKIIKAARHDSLSDGSTTIDNRRNRINSVTRPFNQQKCIYCDRSFGPKSYDRHMEWCKEKSARIDAKSSVNQEAKERLEARVKYKAPSFRSRRSVTREKYAPKGKNVEESTNSTKPQKTNDVTEKVIREPSTISNRPPTPQMKRSEKTEPQKKNNFIRQNVLRCSYKSRLHDKKQPAKDVANKINDVVGSRCNLPYVTSKNTFFNYDGNISATGTRIQPSQPKSKYNESVVQQNRNNETMNFVRSDSEYNPYVSAELQMQQLMKENDLLNGSDDEYLLNSTFIMSSPILTPPSATMTRSADSYRDEKMKNKENLLRSMSNSSGTSSGSNSNRDSPVKKNSHNRIAANKSTRHSPSTVIAMSPTSAFSKYSPVARFKLPNMTEQRVVVGSVQNPISMDRYRSSSGKPNTDNNNPSSDHHFLPPVMSRSADVFDYSTIDNHFTSGRNPSPSVSDRTRNRVMTSIDNGINSSKSSSTFVSSNNGESPVTGDKSKPSKFCHECGARYPVAIAKFCCECGVRRLFL